MTLFPDQNDSDFEQHSPKLRPVELKLSPTLPRPDFVTKFLAEKKQATGRSDSSATDGSGSFKRRRYDPPPPEEIVLLSSLEPNRPDIARNAFRRSSSSASLSDADDKSDDRMGNGATAVVALRTTSPSAFRTKNLIDQAQAGLAVTDFHKTLYPSAPLEPDGEMSVAAQLLRLKQQPPKQPKPSDPTVASLLAPHILTSAEAPTPDKLPALDRGHSSPTNGLLGSQPLTLPPLRPLLEVATLEPPVQLANPHRPRGGSISSLGSGTARSPTMLAKQALNAAGTTAGYIPALPHPSHRSLHLSPGGPLEERSPSLVFDQNSPSSSGRSSIQPQNRRRRATSDAPPVNNSSLIHASSSGSNDSTSSSSSGASSGLDSIGGSSTTSLARSSEFSPPLFSAQPSSSSLSSTHDSAPTSLYRCQFEGCTAPPFQTQYLLNSHANVHSSNRPHYCRVPGCPRGEGGRGFKRKNEMIRHGLVHDSPGYVCPFCPDREHKYPRPDNLQRHVRMHHRAIDRDDPRLQEVMAQRPQGAGLRAGRRRRTTIPA